MPYRVEVTDRAQEDIAELFAWLQKRSVQGAATWLDAAQSTIDRLADEALRYVVDPRSKRLGVEFRLCPFQTPHGRIYVVIYSVDGEAKLVRVLRVRGPGQRPVRRRDLPPP
jgi:plasmid stabilization system protein ParE